jgi:putative ubiquitin-RnfH superfamily antitoxin RatB of RatAB toxin-antitoxin module
MAPGETASGKAEASPESIRIEVIYGPAREAADLTALSLAPGSTLEQALHASGVLQRHGLVLQGLTVGIWGRVQPLGALLRDRDRVEIYRPLQVDPKEARRLRYRGSDTKPHRRLQRRGA